MAKITRYNGDLKAFSSAAAGTERTVFGELSQSDDLTAQITAEFLRGWGIVAPFENPSLQDFNAAMYTHGQLLSYLHQAGLAEYNASQEFFLGSVTQFDGALYISTAAGNIGNQPDTSPSSWRDPAHLKANIASPNFTGIPTAPTAAAGTDTEQIASTEFVQGEIATVVSSIAETAVGKAEIYYMGQF